MTQTAKIYGKALYTLAREEQLEGEILRQLRILSEVFRQTPEYIKLLCTPTITKKERCGILQHDFGGVVQPYVLNAMKLMTERGLMRDFSGSCEEFCHCYNADYGILEATVVTAVPMPDALREKLVQKLHDVTGKQIDLTMRIDPTILGGIRLEMDGEQLDGTIRNRLDNIRAMLRKTVL